VSALIRREKPEVNAKINLSFLPQSSDVESYEPFVLLIDVYLKTLTNERVNYRLQSLVRRSTIP
jgi:hypothetical protein